MLNRLFKLASGFPAMRNIEGDKIGNEIKTVSALESLKDFVDDMNGQMFAFRRFFHVEPVVGEWGETHDVKRTTSVTLGPDFMPGYKCLFIMDNESHEIVGFECEHEEGASNDLE